MIIQFQGKPLTEILQDDAKHANSELWLAINGAKIVNKNADAIIKNTQLLLQRMEGNYGRKNNYHN
jgi:hypothetical protein